MVKHIIGIDPGKTTGISHIRIDVNESITCEAIQLPSDQVMSRLRILFDESLSLQDSQVLVACELWVPRDSRHTRQPDAGELFAEIRELCSRYTFVTFIAQMPSTAKRLTGERLRQLHLWTAGQADHANDATRHAVVCMTLHYPEIMMQLLERYAVVQSLPGDDEDLSS